MGHLPRHDRWQSARAQVRGGGVGGAGGGGAHGGGGWRMGGRRWVNFITRCFMCFLPRAKMLLVTFVASSHKICNSLYMQIAVLAKTGVNSGWSL